MLILIQILTILFAILLAALNEVPVVKMIQCGASRREEKHFHRSNALVKIAYSATVTISLQQSIVQSIILLVTLMLILWLVFDIALNLMLEKSWDYIGDTADTDKWLNNLFPHGDAGEVKAIACVFLITILNGVLWLV